MSTEIRLPGWAERAERIMREFVRLDKPTPLFDAINPAIASDAASPPPELARHQPTATGEELTELGHSILSHLDALDEQDKLDAEAKKQDDELIDLLRDVAAVADPVPQFVTDDAKTAFLARGSTAIVSPRD